MLKLNRVIRKITCIFRSFASYHFAYPSFENLVKIAEVLKCMLVDIFDGAEKPCKRAVVEGEIFAAVKSLPSDRLDLAMKLISVLS